MTQVFISYSRSERPVAARLAERLTEAGYDVWWDAQLVGGQRFEEEIQSALRAAASVIVLWSHASAASDWVRAEAEVARVARSAVPVLIDDVSVDALPLVFRALHTIDLRNWNGDPAASGFRDILSAVGALAGQALGARPATSSHYPQPLPRKPPRRFPIAIAAMAVVVALAGIGAAWWKLRPVADTCDPKDRVTLTEVPLSLCIGAEWVRPPLGSGGDYNSTDGKAILRVNPATAVLSLGDFRQLIVGTAERIAGDQAKIAVIRETDQQIGGRTWKLVEFTNAGKADFLNYYYSADDFGSIQIQAVGDITDLASRNTLAAAVVDSIRFTR